MAASPPGLLAQLPGTTGCVVDALATDIAGCDNTGRALTMYGWGGATVSPDYGGLGLPARTYAEIVMRVSSVWMALTGIFNSHLMLALAIEKYGTAEQKQTWLPKLASGEMRGGLALTEPNAGTDLQGIRMTARRDGDSYVINGTKTWISNGIEGSVFALLVKTDPAAQPRYKGMSLFIAPKGPGFTVGKKLEKLGYKSIDSAEMIFDDYRIPADHLIGGEEGQGFLQATGGLELGRINVAARGVQQPTTLMSPGVGGRIALPGLCE